MTMNLVTGATGLVGFNIVVALRRRGHAVRCLARFPDKARQALPEDVEIVRGDVTDPASLASAARGCAVVYHAAGLPEQWLPDSGTFERVNVGGTRNMVEAARAAGVERFVFTSTIDVFAAERGADFDESVLDPEPKGTYYERSKQAADRVVADAAASGLDAVFLHPSGVYGPGPTQSRGLNVFFADLRDGKMPMLLPGGLPVVFAPDVGEGHVLAAEKAAAGSRYILSERYLDLRDLAAAVLEQVGRGRLPPMLPLWVGRVISAAGEAVSVVTRRPPLIPKGQLHLLQWLARPLAGRAREELGWQATPLEEGLAQTLAFLRAAQAPR